MLPPVLSIVAAAPANGGSWRGVGFALALAIASAVAMRRVRGTTLTLPAAWCVVSAFGIVAVEAGLAWHDIAAETLVASLWRYAAVVGTFCPLMAVLGAKRPQDRGWQWVVLSLWVILLVPVGQALAAPSGNRLELFGAWRMLVGALIVMGLLNYLPTRYGLTAGLVAIGQAILLAGYLFDLPSADQPWRVLMGLALFVAGITCGWLLGAKRFRRGEEDALGSAESLVAQSKRWLAFRNAFGAFWGLRVMQRINQTAELSGWPVRLQWEGFAPVSEPSAIIGAENELIDFHTLSQIKQAFDTLLRRFERINASAPEVDGTPH